MSVVEKLNGFIPSVKNTEVAAKNVLNSILAAKLTPLFDLDGVMLDASHRCKFWTELDAKHGLCQPDQVGSLDLDHYRQFTVHDQVMRDRELPMMEVLQTFNTLGNTYHVATARVVCAANKALFKARGINPELILSRQGDRDTRRDWILKTSLIQARFRPHQFEQLVLIDDCLANCKAVRKLGVKAIHIDHKWEPEAKRERAEERLSAELGGLDIRGLV